jgi:UDP-glucose 4-epimerase
MRALVTGGAGLVGSSFIRKLIDRGAAVFCVDSLVLGTLRHLEDFRSNPDFRFEKWDLSERGWQKRLRGERFDLCVHLAANSDISLGNRYPETDYRRTLATTFETLEACRELEIPNLMFASTSAVYGAEPIFPTPELATGMHPVSIYGAGKLASEAFISAFVENYGLNAWVFRFGNVVGKRLTHGVIFDFVKRLRENPEELRVLGDGKQTKTYIDVEDCVEGMWRGFEKSPAGTGHPTKFQVFNLSTDGTVSVKQIAEETVSVVTDGKTRIAYGTSPVGWVGDVPRTSLDIRKISALGWKPKLDSTAAVFRAIRDHYEWTR